MKTREELQSKWEEIVDKGFRNYESLSRAERVWFNLEPLTTGGLFDQYMNYGAEHIEKTIEDLVYLGLDDIAELIRQMNMLFPDETPPKDIDKRNEVIQKWTMDQEKQMDFIDEKFWEKCENLEKTLLAFINKSDL
ncbi:DMP19 family protein [Mucilaginibacter jinjuensis]|uniref:DUF4375 domain-containing protein n=1 Tax=Mucilaginibacter jinjuensis TaxID=1176721 RepID=A0ABY7T4U6_9SPHI|nr:DUF4375 domain-containing protein [Mucilaginibacter jinjuensis]WCT11490.1 DUF4375 domain-containing protein [Mucilaginibacter jinjuensis]